jgi:hypothetical protein
MTSSIMFAFVTYVSVQSRHKILRWGFIQRHQRLTLLESDFIDFMETLLRTKRGNQTILVVINNFYKYVAFYSVRNINSEVVCDITESQYFTDFGTAQVHSFRHCERFQGKGTFF